MDGRHENMKKDNKCPEKAMFIASWAGKLMKGCDTHINDLRVLGNVIGSPVEVQLIITEEPCFGQNDFEERKKK